MIYNLKIEYAMYSYTIIKIAHIVYNCYLTKSALNASFLRSVHLQSWYMS